MSEEESPTRVKCRELLGLSMDLYERYLVYQKEHHDLETAIKATRSPSRKRSLITQRTHLRNKITEIKAGMESSFQNFAVCEVQQLQESSLLEGWTEEVQQEIKRYAKQLRKKHGIVILP